MSKMFLLTLSSSLLFASATQAHNASITDINHYANQEKLETTKMADKVLQQIPILKGKYFKKLNSKKMTLEQFQSSQKQFGFAVDYFSRPMAALVARLPDHADRVSILENIMEEHGGFDSTKYHSNTFKLFLKSIGCSQEDIDHRVISPVIRAFNLDLMAVSLNEDPCMAIGCFGIIEYAFADISAAIGRAVVERKWVSQQDLVHYSLHAELDKEHAEEFFELVEPLLHDSTKKANFQAGLELGAYIFNRLYEDLYLEAHTAVKP